MTPDLTFVVIIMSLTVLLARSSIMLCLRSFKKSLRIASIMMAGEDHGAIAWKQIAVVAVVAVAFTADTARANGINPTVVAGQASFSTLGSSLNITNSPGAIINWQGFSIGADETTSFIQQNAASSILNRVLGSDPSIILGTLTSNGKVFLINPSGVLFGQGSRIDVGGLVASTLDLSNRDFLAGKLNFTSTLLNGMVENRGYITTPSGGSVYLVGSNVSNSGIINSPGGDVILAAGQSVKIFDTSTPGVRVELSASENFAVNLGEILAQSGEVGIYGSALRNSGIINADQVARDGNGRIILRAKQDVTLEVGSRISANGEQAGEITVQSETGTTLVSGTIEAKGTGELAGSGGSAKLLGNHVGLVSANVDVSGTTGGGTVLVGGDYQGNNPSVQNASATYVSSDSNIAANAVTSGNGGKAIIWADDSTRFNGGISARGGAQSGDGGFVEVSGKHYLDFRGIVDTRAPMGQDGTLLLDPDEIQIINAAGGAALAMTCTGGGDCTTPTGTGPYFDTASSATIGTLPDHTINQQLALGNVTVQTSTGGIFISNVNSTVTLGPTTGPGDVAGGNAASNANTLKLNSATNISWNAPWSYRNTGQLTLLANSGSIEGTGAFTLTDVSPLLMQAATNIGLSWAPVAISGNGGNVTITAGASVTLGNISAGAGTISATSSGSGDITISGPLTNTNSGTSAVTLNSTSGSGNVMIAGGSISTPGRATIFTNTIAGSSGMTALVGSGSGHFRYNGVTTGLGTGIYAVYTEQPTLTVTAATPPAITYGDATPVLTTTVTGLQNGDTTLQALSTTATVAVGGPTSSSGNYTVGTHTLTPSAVSQLGYALGYVNGTLTVSKFALAVSAAGVNKVYDGLTTATATLADNRKTGDMLGTSYSTAEYLNENVGNGKTVNVGGILLSGTDAGNYTVNSTTTTTANIIPAPLGIAANSTTKIYGSTVNFAGTEFSSSGLKNGETVGSVSLASAGAAPTAGVTGGPYNIIPSAATGGTFSSGNYSISYTDGTLGVTPAPLGIAANSATRLYGDANPAFSATYTGFQNGETSAALTGTLSLTTPAVATSNIGNYAIIPSGQSSSNYTVAYVNGKLNITPAPLGIAANSTTKTYGSTVIFTGSEFSSSGLKNGETVGGVSLSSAGAAATASVAGGPYDITASAASGGTFSAGNYSISYTDGTLGVTPAPLGIAANSSTKTYGDVVNFTGSEFSSSGLKNGESVGSVTLASLGAAADADVLGSPYTITVSAASGGTFNAGNYSISYVDGALGVLPAGLLGIAANSAVKTYNGLAFSGGNGVNYTGFRAGDTPASLEGTLAYGGSSQGAVNVGSYTISPFGQSSPNYTIAYVSGKLSVTPAPLGIAANSATRLYGDANPAFSATYTGFQNGETSSVLTGALTLTTPAAATSTVGTYAIIPSGQSSPNYTVAYVNGKLSVTPAPLGIAANSSTKTYGSTVSFTGSEFTSNGLKNGETVGSVNLTSAGAAATAPVAGGSYDIAASAASGGTFSAGNYSIIYADGTLGVIPAPLGIAANSATRLYGTANPAFSATYTGFQNGENITALNGTLAFSTPAVPASNAGNYAIIPSGQSSTNYTISYVNGSMRVTPVPLMISANNISKIYGTSDPTLTFGTVGLVNNPALGLVDTVDSVFSGALTRTLGETVLGGPYAITQGTLATNGNYTLSSFTGGTFDIMPALLTVATDIQTKVYGTSDPALTFSTAGLVINPSLGIADTADSVLTGAITRIPGETVAGGPYSITQGTLAANSNYTVGSFTGSNLTITPSALHVSANPQSKLFGQSDPALTYSVTGLVNNPVLGIADSATAVLSGALTRAPGESSLGGPYRINQGNLAANSNYTLGFTGNNLIITGAAAEPVLGYDAVQVIFAGVINNEYYYRPGNFWHISLNPNNADPGFDVMRGTNDLNSRMSKRMDRCDSVFGGGMCESWSFPQQREKTKGEK